MKSLSLSYARLRHSAILFLALFTIAFSAAIVLAQAPPLSLADILIGLRSKKVSIEERNQILTQAVKERGITFEITPEIEKELATTGASADLIAAIHVKSAALQSKPKPKPTVAAQPTPSPTPAPPDYTFYQKRADTSLSKGEAEAALADYNKALELKNDVPDLYLARGRAYFSMKSYDLSVKDFDKAIELAPKTAVAFLSRGRSYEQLGQKDKALADYKKAVELDSANEVAKAEAKRLQDEIAKEEAAKAAEAARLAKPEYLSLGNIGADEAVRLVTPVYPPIARQSRIGGLVTVEVEIDTEGNVTSAKATSGHTMLRGAAEEAARRSKFKPSNYNGEPIKARGVITFNFTP
ncbi:MAG TPA: TonB family protein [Pyrinomonadaceae bacterium]|jgi:TonB family protein|nr:TonB family protein [Pyrinomonadaceae bacterium]